MRPLQPAPALPSGRTAGRFIDRSFQSIASHALDCEDRKAGTGQRARIGFLLRDDSIEGARMRVYENDVRAWPMRLGLRLPGTRHVAMRQRCLVASLHFVEFLWVTDFLS